MLKATRFRRVQCPLAALILILVFLCSQNLNAQGAVSNYSKTVTINETNSSLRSIFKIITKQTKLKFLGSSSILDLSEKHSIKVKNGSIDQILDELLKREGLQWGIEDGLIIIQKAKSEEYHLPLVLHQSDTTITVSGKVINEKGEPINGATVLIKGTQIGTTTDSNGRFQLESIKSNTFIIISNVGFQSKEIALKNKKNLESILLKEYVGVLDETVIIAYGNTTRRLNTGNIVSIKAETIAKQPVNNPLYALQGRVAGLTITPTSGLPGAQIDLQIRGKNSIGQLSNPLIVVDGLPIPNSITGLSTEYLSNLSAISFINPNDIESIDILKDADATSIYGSRGSNGVILITTKKGKPGQTKIDVNVQNGWSKVSRKIDLLNTPQYLTLSKEAWANAGVDFINTFPYGLPEEYKYVITPALTLWDQNRYTDWQENLIGGTGQYKDVQASISGGNNSISYALGANYHREGTVFPGNNADKKGGAHFSLIGSSDDKRFKAALTGSYQGDHNMLPGIDFTGIAISLPPNAPAIFKGDGNLNWENAPSGEQSWENPYYNLYTIYDAKVTNIIASADLSYKILPSLFIRTQLGFNELRGNSFKKNYPFEGRNPTYINDPGSASFKESGTKSLSIEPQISYEKEIKGNKISVLIGGSIQSTSTESEDILADGFTDDAFFRNLGSATAYYIRNLSSQYKYAAFFGRVNYNWRNKYLVNLSARRDGSSRFGPGKQFGNFGSAGIAWIFTEEKFVSSLFPFMSFGKLRFSYGTSGNDGIGDYQYLEKYTAVGVDIPYQGAKGYTTSGLFNSYYAWEVTRKMELGLETGFLNDRILVNASYFRNRSDNQLVAYPYPTQAGPGFATVNLPALIQNIGLELILNLENVKSNSFSWTTSFNFTRNRNKLISFPNIENTGYAYLEVGKPFNQVQAYHFNGVDPTTGRYQFQDPNGKFTFVPEDATRNDFGKYERIMTGPKFYGGISNTFSFKRLSLDFLFQYSKQKGINPLASFMFAAGSRNMPIDYLSRWQKPNDITSIQQLVANFPSDISQGINYLTQSDWNYVDASFIRLKNLSISYTIPNLLKDRLRLKSLKVFILGQNLWTITSYKGLDPETQSMGSLPPLRVVMLGINAAF